MSVDSENKNVFHAKVQSLALALIRAAQCIKVMTGNRAKSSQPDKIMQQQTVSGKERSISGTIYTD